MSHARITIFCLCLVAASGCDVHTSGDADTSIVHPPGDAGDIWDDGFDAPDAPPDLRLPQVDVQISSAALVRLHHNPQTREEIDVRIDVEGQVYGDCEIELHGGFARTVPKLSYRLRFDSDDPLVTTLFSDTPETHRRLVLQASWIDPSYIRNCMTFDLVRSLGGLAPRCEFVELSFNGTYQGLFVAIERVDEVFLQRNGLLPEGLLIKASNHNANWAEKSDPMAGFELHVNDDAPTDALGELLSVLHDTPADAERFAASVEPWLDLDDFMSWQLAHTLADNRDTFTKNYYLHYDWVTADTPFRIISWDADATWGISWDGAVVDPGVQDRTWGNDAFSPRLFSIPEYRDPYLARYVDLVMGDDLRDQLLSDIDDRAARIRAAATRDLASWERSAEFDAEVEYLRAAVEARFAAMVAALAD